MLPQSLKSETESRNTPSRYVPALGYEMLTALYDPVVALTTRERTFKQLLIQQAAIRDGQTVLDLACGTGTLAIWIKQHVPGARVHGMDADSKILSLAERKAKKNGVDILFAHGFSTHLPYDDASFDRVLCSLFFHHLSREDKGRTIREVLRVLKPNGEFHVADWGKPQNALMHGLFLLVRILDGFETTRENMQGELPALFAVGGFRDVEVRSEIATAVGTMTLYAMRK